MGKTDFVTLESAMVRDWLNARIKALRDLKETDRLGDLVETIPTEMEVHLYNRIEMVADAVGGELQEEYYQGNYFYHFLYEGVKVLQISPERLGKVCRKSRRMKA